MIWLPNFKHQILMLDQFFNLIYKIHAILCNFQVLIPILSNFYLTIYINYFKLYLFLQLFQIFRLQLTNFFNLILL